MMRVFTRRSTPHTVSEQITVKFYHSNRTMLTVVVQNQIPHHCDERWRVHEINYLLY